MNSLGPEVDQLILREIKAHLFSFSILTEMCASELRKSCL